MEPFFWVKLPLRSCCCTLTFQILHFKVLTFFYVKFFWLVFKQKILHFKMQIFFNILQQRILRQHAKWRNFAYRFWLRSTINEVNNWALEVLRVGEEKPQQCKSSWSSLFCVPIFTVNDLFTRICVSLDQPID